MAHVDRAVIEAGGIALRYGGFHGNADDQVVNLVRKRRFPMIGDGEGFYRLSCNGNVTVWVVRMCGACDRCSSAFFRLGPRAWSFSVSTPGSRGPPREKSPGAWSSRRRPRYWRPKPVKGFRA